MSELTKTSAPVFQDYPKIDLKLKLRAKVYKQEGDLAYKYLAFRNIQQADGQLKSFNTEELNFKLTNPVDILVLPSYDGTVNLILNDDVNPPRLINSRFTVTEDKRYKIIDRKGDNDTNIYDEDNVDLETRLFKNYNKIPYIDFEGLQEGGNLVSGVYCFYFKYTDADGNETDIIAETGAIPVHLGSINTPHSCSGGVLDEPCNKIIKLKINNIDTSYDYLLIYYTRKTGEDSFNDLTFCYKILDKKIITSPELELSITGFENKMAIEADQLNVQYLIVDRVKTQALVQNMLFFANVDKPTIPYDELTDLSVRIYPRVSNRHNIGWLNELYQPNDSVLENVEYYNMQNVYKYTGYWNNEIYRFGIVYVLKDDSISPVFNITGCDGLNSETKFKFDDLYRDGKRQYITLDEKGFSVDPQNRLQNTKGVVRLDHTEPKIMRETNDGIKGLYPLGIDFIIEDAVLNEIKKYAKGFFFVRQKRIPTVLGQGLSIAVDQESKLPCLKINDKFVMEGFLDVDRNLTNNFDRHLLEDDGVGMVYFNAMLSPELQNNKFISAGIFNNSDFYLSNSCLDTTGKLTRSDRHFYPESYENKNALQEIVKSKLSNVGDAQIVKVLDTLKFSTMAGIAEEAYKFKYFVTLDKTTKCRNIVRGQFTPFIASSYKLPEHKIFNVHIPGYNPTLMEDYFKVRFESFYNYYAIGNRYDLSVDISSYDNISHIIEEPQDPEDERQDFYRVTEYRGDCYINTVTVRMNRNFVDPETPVNDTIIDYQTWKNNYLADDDTSKKKDNANINRSDVNAVQLGHWITFKVFSNINLALRSLDKSFASELALLGQPRGFYPVLYMNTESSAKMPESELYNAGFRVTTSEKEYVELPDVPYIKNIFDSRIMFSTRHINDAFKNGYRIFLGMSYKDVTRQYGAIVKIYNWNDNILCIFENGIALFAINERALIQTEAGAGVHMYGAGVLPEKETPVSVDFGSRWRDSIIKTPVGIYGVDTEAKKIWRFSAQGFEILSDMKVLKFLNENLIMDADEYLPIMALRNVKTHYDNFKGDVIFTFYDITRDEAREWSLVYNERVGKWITRISWQPLLSENINNIFISYDRTGAAYSNALNAYTLESADISEGITLTNNIPEEVETPQSGHYIGDFVLKGYDYYDKYTQRTYKILNDLDEERYRIEDYKLYINPEYFASVKDEGFLDILEVSLEMKNNEAQAPDFKDYIVVRYNDAGLRETFLYKHGQANLFNNTNNDPQPCLWYDKLQPFEFEFIVNDKMHLLKIFDNLKIISNNIKPDELVVTVCGDSYEDTLDDYTMEQKVKDIRTAGRLKGNALYLENIWNIQLEPLSIKSKQSKLRNKYAKIRLKYIGENLVIITAILTLYRISYG